MSWCSTPSASCAQVYQLATVAFVGGSLVPTGGHNILEPAVYGRPVVFGPSMTNFAEIAETVPGQRRGRPGALGARARGDAHRADERLGAPRGHRRGGARAGGRQPRRDRDGRSTSLVGSAAATRRGPAFPPRALTRGHCQPALYRARPPAPHDGGDHAGRITPVASAGRQHRQPRRRRQRQDAADRAGRATAGRGRRAPGRAEPRLRPHGPRRRA